MVTILRDKVTLVDDDSGRELTIATTKTEEGDEIITLDNETLSKWVTGRPHGLRGGQVLGVVEGPAQLECCAYHALSAHSADGPWLD